MRGPLHYAGAVEIRPLRPLPLLAGALAAVSVSLAPAASALERPQSGAGPTSAHAYQPFSLRLEDQLLAELRYLPLTFTPSGTHTTPTTTTTTTVPVTTTTGAPTGTSTTTTTASTTTSTTTTSVPVTTTQGSTGAFATRTVRGTFTWRFRHLPRPLTSQWRVGTDNVLVRGALMQFQLVHSLATTGNIDTTTWHALQSAVARHQIDPYPFANVLVTEKLPQNLALFVNGKVVYRSLVNTGIAQAPTAVGTYPVYLRYVTTTMSGTLPNGQPYHDTGIPWTSYFNGGDALHGFLRSTYGWPQSLGCVEMPFANAKKVWVHTPIGTLVTVIAH